MTQRSPFRYFKTSPEIIRLGGDAVRPLSALATERRGPPASARDRKAALKFLRKTMKLHGRPHVCVTDKLRSCGAALKNPGLPDDRETGCWLNTRAENSLRGPSVHISRSDDGNAPCSAFAGCDHCRSSSPSTRPSTTSSMRSAAFPVGTTSRQAALPPSSSGSSFVQPDTG